MNVRISIKLSLKFVPKGPINNIPALVQIMALHRPGNKPLFEPMMVRSLTHMCVTRRRWVKSSFCVAIWQAHPRQYLLSNFDEREKGPFLTQISRLKHFARSCEKASRNMILSWWRHQMGNVFSQRAVTQSYDVFFDLRLIKRLSKQSRRQWFERQSHSLWRRCNVRCIDYFIVIFC